MKLLITISALLLSSCASTKWIEKNYENHTGIIAYRTDLAFREASAQKADSEIKNYCQANYKIIAEGESETFAGYTHSAYSSSAVNHSWLNIKFMCLKN